MLVNHLAFELNGDPSNININEIEPEEPTPICLTWPFSWHYTKEDITIKGKKITDEKIKIIVRKTHEIGIKAKVQFLRMLDDKGCDNYLKKIVDSYEKAIDSFSDMNNDIESSKNII